MNFTTLNFSILTDDTIAILGLIIARQYACGKVK